MMEIGANTNNSPRQIPEITSTKKESVGKNISIYVANKKRKFIYRGSITKRTCEDCGHVFCSSSNLARHKRDNRCGRLHTSHLSGSWNCRRCKQIYRFYPLYVKHIKMCGKQAETVSSLHNEPQMENKQTKIIEQTIPNKKLGGFRSVLQKSFNLPSKCKVCGLNFRSILHYKTHLSRKGYCRPRPFTCYSCGKIFDTIHHLVAHENRKSPCVSTELSSPEKMASDKTDLLRNTFDVKNYNSVMGSELENQRQYFNFTGQEKEVNKEAEAGENQCEKCGIIFDSPFLCQRHKLYDSPCAISSATSTGDNSSPDIVKSSYSRRNLRARIPFSVHAPKRHSKREHQCKKCGYVFSRAYRLRSHLNRKFPCVPLRQHFLTTHSRSARKTMPPARLQNEFLYQNNLELAEQTSQDEKSKKHYKSVHSKILKKYQKITSCRPKINIEPEIKPPVCEFCNKTFVSAKSFIKHMQLHPGFVASNHPVKCPGCPEVFPNPDDLFEHQKAEKHWGPMMSRTRECECPFCGKEFLYIGRRNSHARLIHMQSNPKEVRKFLDETTCNICYRQFVDAYETYAHIQSEHQGVSPPSLERNYISASESESLSIPEEIIVNKPESLKKKIETMTPNLLALMKKYPTKCPFCLKIYSSSYVRDRHLKCHTMEKPFVCSWCKKCFPRSERLTRHYQQVHNDLLLFKCLGCGMKFPTRLQTVQHIGKAHAGASRSSLLYEIKLESSKTVQPLATEMLKEECVKKPFHYPKPGLILSPDDTVRGIYSCEVCGIHNFTKMTALHRHKKSGFHRENLKQVKSQTSKSLSGTRVSVNYNCSVCDVSYSNIVSFVPHRLSHFQAKNLDPSEINENNPYSCEICQRSIDHHQKVQAHLLWHLQADRTSRLINSTDSGAVSQAKGILNDKILIPGDSFHGKADVEIGSKTKSLENVAKKSIQTSITLQGNVYNKSHVEKIAVDVNTEEKSQKNAFTCQKCEAMFSTKQHLTTHVCHFFPFKITSKDCIKSSSEHKSFFSNTDVDHQSTILDDSLAFDDSTVTCTHCSLRLFSPKDLEWHEKSCSKVHSSEKIDLNCTKTSKLYQCKYCCCGFITLEICHEHERAYCKKSQTCEHCRLDFNSHQDLIDHIENYHSANHQLKCYVCGQAFYSPRVLKKHLESHEEEIAFNCLYCAAFFSDLKSLFEHLESHEVKLNLQQHYDIDLEKEDIPNQAEPVKNYNSEKSVKNLKLFCVEDSKIKFHCPYCPRGYKDRAHFREHIVIHEPFHCEVCGGVENTVVGFRKHPCKLPNGNLATGILYRKSWGKKMIQLAKKKRFKSFNSTASAKAASVDQQECKFEGNDCDKGDGSKDLATIQLKITNDLSEKYKEKIENYSQKTLDNLRENFSQLLYFLVADPELMEQLGWGVKLIDTVLDDVLYHMEQQPVGYQDKQTELERLRKNIQLLLRVSVKDHVMDDVERGRKVIDELVLEMLEMCTSKLSEDSLDINREWSSTTD